MSFKQYIQDYDGKYPCFGLANTPDPDGERFGWVDVLQPYLKSKQIFQCPQDHDAAQAGPNQPGYTDYWFNARMSGVRETDLKEQALTLINGDGSDGNDDTSARYHLRSIPFAWLGNEKSPLYRHSNNGERYGNPTFYGANFAFADGHAKWLKGEDWKNGVDFGGTTKATFRLKPTK